MQDLLTSAAVSVAAAPDGIRLRVLSLGAGVQSTTLALMAAHGEVGPMPNCAIFSDTGWEPKAVYDHLAWLRSPNVLPFPVHVVSSGNIRDDLIAGAQGARWASIPAFTRNVTVAGTTLPVFDEDEDGELVAVGERILSTVRVGVGMIRRQCTKDYKIVPIRRKVRELVGLSRRRSPETPIVEQWIGISLDEAIRMKPSFETWQLNRWPLIEQRFSRHDCLRWLQRHDYPIPPKSACIGCPFTLTLIGAARGRLTPKPGPTLSPSITPSAPAFAAFAARSSCIAPPWRSMRPTSRPPAIMVSSICGPTNVKACAASDRLKPGKAERRVSALRFSGLSVLRRGDREKEGCAGLGGGLEVERVSRPPAAETTPMATAVQKINLSSSRDIPFNKLVLSQFNVRRVKAGVSVEELAADIAERSLLQSLNVRPVLDAGGGETGMFEVPAGGRRYRALELLVKQKRLAKTAPVPCVVRDPSARTLAEEDSLAENVQRAPLHPLDQFRAFQTLREKGRTEEDIAAAFFVGVNVVKQRLRLASVSPTLLDLYAEDAMSLDQLMAFTVTSDHVRQEQVWQAISGSWSKEPYQIRRMLTEKTVRASDRRAVFVGLEAYEAAGGVVLRDLFQSDDGGWLEDIALLDRLVGEKLKAEAEAIAAQGWKWIEVAIDFPYGHTHGLRALEGLAEDLTAEEQATVAALKAEYEKLETEYDGADELPDEVDERLGEIEAALSAFDDRPLAFDAADIARAGVFVCIDAQGGLAVDRGYVRPEDEATEDEPEQDGETDPATAEGRAADPNGSVVQRAVITIGGQIAGPEDEDDEELKPLPDRLVTELTAERTLALRDKLATTPTVAFQAVLHKFCLDVFSRYLSYGTAMEVSVRSVAFPVQAQGLKQTPAARAIEARHKAWEERLPKDKADLWNWLTTLTGEEQAALFAHCASFGVNALYEKGDRYGAGASSHTVALRIAEADRLAEAVGLDMVEAGWRPTVEAYLDRVPKARILEAVREGAGERAAQLIDHLKKADMAKEAERLLAESCWLPEPLRGAGRDDEPAGAEEDGEALPEFLAGDDETAEAVAAEAPQMIAAE